VHLESPHQSIKPFPPTGLNQTRGSCAPGVLRRSNRLPFKLKRQREGAALSYPVRLEAGVQILAEAGPGQSARTWDLLRTVLDEGFQLVFEPLPPQSQRSKWQVFSGADTSAPFRN
jgi:hypothetical protein